MSGPFKTKVTVEFNVYEIDPSFRPPDGIRPPENIADAVEVARAAIRFLQNTKYTVIDKATGRRIAAMVSVIITDTEHGGWPRLKPEEWCSCDPKWSGPLRIRQGGRLMCSICDKPVKEKRRFSDG